MDDDMVKPDMVRSLLSVSQDLLDKRFLNLTAERLIDDLSETLEKNLGLKLSGVWVRDGSNWDRVYSLESSAHVDFPGELTDRQSMIEGDSVVWWPIPGETIERNVAVLAVESDRDTSDLEQCYEELLSTLRIFMDEVYSEITVARHELMEIPDDLSPNLEEAKRTGSLDEVLQSLVESAGRLFECDNCRLFWREDEEHLRLRAESSKTDELGTTLSIEQDPIVQSVIRDEKSIIINNLPEHEESGRRGENIRSFLSVPFRHGDNVSGTLNLSSEDKGVFTRDDLEQLSAVADNFGFVHEITTELANLSGYVEEILSNLPVGVLTVDYENDVVRLNPEARTVLDTDRDRMSRDQFHSHLRDRIDGEALMDVVDRMSESDESQQDEFQLGTEEGVPRTIEAFGSTVHNVDGTSKRIILVLNDVTEQRILGEQVNRAERLAALGELAAGLAHEIKNPLTSIQGFVQLLPERSDDEDFLEKTSDVIERESRRLNALVDNLVSFARPQIGSRSDFLLTDVLEDIEMLISKRLEKQDITYSLDVPDGLRLFGDDQKLKQVLINLVLNALDAMGEGGTLSVSARKDDKDFTIIIVEDTGQGIEENEIDEIINPFYTTKDEGTGLGLAISHRIVEEHGGTIEFESTPGEGTTVEVAIPPEHLQQESSNNHTPEYLTRSTGDKQ